MSRAAARALLWMLWVANLLAVAGLWAFNSGAQLVGGELSPVLAFARLAGLLATFAALTQFVLMGREGWLELFFGMDHLARFHRLNGYAAICLMLLHAALVVPAYASLAAQPPWQQFLDFLSVPTLFAAVTALLLFVAVVACSIYIVRRHLKFESWYNVHLLTYAAIALVPLHQLTQGGDLLMDHVFYWYWLSLYAFVALNMLVWRFGRPVFLSLRHQFSVERVVAEAPRATSIYITGSKLQKFRARPGQFVLVRFLARGMWWQEHPFSLSRLPNGHNFRLTIRALGDFTNAVPQLKPGTRVMVSGPHGAFTPEAATNTKRLYIAGGVGITPIRALIEGELLGPSRSVLLYGNKTKPEIIFKAELDKLSKQLAMPIYHILSDQPGPSGGYIDAAKITKLVPDVAEREVFLCGPPAMMQSVLQALAELGVPQNQVHYERFALHKAG